MKSEIEKIIEEVKERGIEHFVHFTDVRNLDSILKNGILSVYDLKKFNIYYKKNDKFRYDNREDCISLTVEFPNDYFLSKLRRENKNLEFCLLFINAEKLFNIDVNKFYFVPFNASRNEINQKLKIKKEIFSTHKAFLDLFAEQSANSRHPCTRSKIGIDDMPFFPTDSQAEILVEGKIPLSCLDMVCFETNEVAVKFLECSNKENIEKCRNKNIKFLICNKYFRLRKQFIMEEKPWQLDHTL